MAEVTITPGEAKKYKGSGTTSEGNYWIGRPVGYSSAFAVRYAFESPRKLKKITVQINGTLEGAVDSTFRYCLSTSPDYPGEWTKVTEAGKDHISIIHEEELAANTTYYLFVGKSTAGNYVYYRGCSAENVSITGETAGGVVRVAVDGEVKEAVPKVYKDGVWKDLTPRVYKNGTWEEMS